MKLSPQARFERIIWMRIGNFAQSPIGERNLGNCTVPITVDKMATGKVAEMGYGSAADAEGEKRSSQDGSKP